MCNFERSVKAIVREFYNDNSPPKYIVDYNAEIPTVDKNSVLIQVKACALSEISDKVLRGVLKNSSTTRSRLPVGQDIAGIVQHVGSEVETLRRGDPVVGIVPLDAGSSGCAECVVLGEYDVVRKPPAVSFVDAAGCAGDALAAYTALHYLGRMRSGQTVLVADGASAFGSLAVQLALHWGARVIATAATEDERLYLRGIRPEIERIVDTSKPGFSLKNACLEETGGMGVDIIIDNGALTMFKKEDLKNGNANVTISKQEVINALAVGGRWITRCHALQLDPPNSRLLYRKCASVGFLFEHAWALSSGQQGAFQHILMDIMEKVAEGTIRPNIHHTVSFDAIPEAIRCLHEIRVGKVIGTL